jgi:hypothetical protein
MRDDTAAVQAKLDEAAENGTVAVLESRTYRITRPLRMAGKGLAMVVLPRYEQIRRRIAVAVCNFLGITYAFGAMRKEIASSREIERQMATQLNSNTLTLKRWAEESAVLSSIEEKHRRRQVTLNGDKS